MSEAPKLFRYLVLPFAVVVIVTGSEWLISETVPAPANAAIWKPPGFGPASYEQALEHSGNQIALGEERVENGPNEWLPHESLARAHLSRSHLAFNYDDLIVAGDSLSLARRLAPSGSGPLLTEAVFAQMTHQPERVEESLAAIDKWAVNSDPAVLAESAALRGDLSFYRGNPASARKHYDEVDRLLGKGGASYRLAILEKSAGNFDLAIRHFREANRLSRHATPQATASIALQIGAVELARGNYTSATEWFARADRQFPGYWLIDAHLAQAKALVGDLSGAIADMRAIAGRAPSAEVMDALAMLLRADGQARESRRWAQRAGAVWDRRLKQLPTAAYGHAVEHELVFGTPQRALELARQNVATRPYGEARILLASALLANGKTQEALGQLALAEQSGWRSAALYAVLAQAYELSGKSAEAENARGAALALNGRIFEPETSLVWLSHG